MILLIRYFPNAKLYDAVATNDLNEMPVMAFSFHSFKESEEYFQMYNEKGEGIGMARKESYEKIVRWI